MVGFNGYNAGVFKKRHRLILSAVKSMILKDILNANKTAWSL